jgi:predicted DNA-binding transcriptional regulator AlpA
MGTYARITHASYLREKARSMRVERQLTIDELAERLALSRSTVYYWVRDLPIPRSGPGGPWPEAARRKGNLAMQRKYRLLREAGV